MNQNSVCSKFEEWTRGLGPRESRIALFERIRDIPYAIIPWLVDPHRGSAGPLFLAGDYMTYPAFDGAVVSGLRAYERLEEYYEADGFDRKS